MSLGNELSLVLCVILEKLIDDSHAFFSNGNIFILACAFVSFLSILLFRGQKLRLAADHLIKTPLL
jgi:hypothetical protein